MHACMRVVRPPALGRAATAAAGATAGQTAAAPPPSHLHALHAYLLYQLCEHARVALYRRPRLPLAAHGLCGEAWTRAELTRQAADAMEDSVDCRGQRSVPWLARNPRSHRVHRLRCHSCAAHWLAASPSSTHTSRAGRYAAPDNPLLSHRSTRARSRRQRGSSSPLSSQTAAMNELEVG